MQHHNTINKQLISEYINLLCPSVITCGLFCQAIYCVDAVKWLIELMKLTSIKFELKTNVSSKTNFKISARYETYWWDFNMFNVFDHNDAMW